MRNANKPRKCRNYRIRLESDSEEEDFDFQVFPPRNGNKSKEENARPSSDEWDEQMEAETDEEEDARDNRYVAFVNYRPEMDRDGFEADVDSPDECSTCGENSIPILTEEQIEMVRMGSLQKFKKLRKKMPKHIRFHDVEDRINYCSRARTETHCLRNLDARSDGQVDVFESESDEECRRRNSFSIDIQSKTGSGKFLKRKAEESQEFIQMADGVKALSFKKFKNF